MIVSADGYEPWWNSEIGNFFSKNNYLGSCDTLVCISAIHNYLIQSVWNIKSYANLSPMTSVEVRI